MPPLRLFCSIYETVGRGKHSTVYKGRKKQTIHYYAIKSVEKDQKARVLQEVSLSSPSLTLLQAAAIESPINGRNGSKLSDPVQVRAMHALNHQNVLRFFAW